jgi:uncharacterized protein (UPF0332 family)
VAFDAYEFHTLANWLVANQTNEASLRTAISRMYYAAHLLARERLITKRNWSPTGGGADHSGVINALRRGRTSQLSYNLRELLRLREHADYHLEAMDTALNQQCLHCQKVRESAAGTPVVNKSHWDNVHELSQAVFPQLDRL